MTIPLQRHIHLATDIGSIPEKAPTLKWSTTDRLLIPTAFISVRRSITGVLRPYRLVNLSGTVQLKNWRYRMKIAADWGRTLDESIADITALNGRMAYLCDSFHADDGADHTSYIQSVFLSKMSELEAVGVGLQYFYVDIELEDATL